jgi:hypothetical protein
VITTEASNADVHNPVMRTKSLATAAVRYLVSDVVHNAPACVEMATTRTDLDRGFHRTTNRSNLDLTVNCPPPSQLAGAANYDVSRTIASDSEGRDDADGGDNEDDADPARGVRRHQPSADRRPWGVGVRSDSAAANIRYADANDSQDLGELDDNSPEDDTAQLLDEVRSIASTAVPFDQPPFTRSRRCGHPRVPRSELSSTGRSRNAHRVGCAMRRSKSWRRPTL